MRLTFIPAVIALGLLIPNQVARADLVFNDGLTHTIDTTLPVENISLSNNTVLNVSPTGSVTGSDAVDGYDWIYAVTADHSTLSINGGSVTAGLSQSSGAIYSNYSNININDGSSVTGTLTGALENYAFGIEAYNSVIISMAGM